VRNNDNILFIDAKGVSHNARVQSFREHRDQKQELVHDEPLVTLNYNAPPTGEPQTLIDVPHISHPSRQENNPELPSYPLHAWKYEDEEHLQVPADHPLHDHLNEQPKLDEQGKVIPKRRPHYEMHQRMHQARTRLGDSFEHNGPDGGAQHPVKTFTTKEAFTTPPTPSVEVGHPAHPDTVKFLFQCDSCGATVTRTASHNGGKQWEPKPGAQAEGAVLGGDNSHLWQEHVCKPEDVAKHHAKLNPPKEKPAPEPTASERLAAGEPLAPPSPAIGAEVEEAVDDEEEPGVIAQLEKDAKTPAPTEKEEKPPTDAA